MHEFDEQDWKEVCARVRGYENAFKATLSEDDLRPYKQNKELQHINELGLTLKDYERVISGHCREIHEHVYKICCLGRVCPENLSHWKNEILTQISELYDPVLKKGMRKDKILHNRFIDMFLDSKTFMPDGDDMFISAMNSELNAAKKRPNDPARKKEAEYIRKYILPNITDYRESNMFSVAKLMKSFYNGIVDRNIDMIETALNEYIEMYTPE